jgi:hypothetical protein
LRQGRLVDHTQIVAAADPTSAAQLALRDQLG